jgi:ABC-2 type transport system ATP-binding protein
LGLTILLSSHFLSEVEQLCTRIAVLNRGRKVFEGTLAETKRNEQWVRVKTGDFKIGASALRQAGLITGERDGQFIALREGTGTDQVVRFLVERGMPVYEIAREQETLESFYLSLMNEQNSKPAPDTDGKLKTGPG